MCCGYLNPKNGQACTGGGVWLNQVVYQGWLDVSWFNDVAVRFWAIRGKW